MSVNRTNGHGPKAEPLRVASEAEVAEILRRVVEVLLTRPLPIVEAAIVQRLVEDDERVR